MILKGKVWKFGDKVPTSYFLSGKYDSLSRKGEYRQLAQHILEDVDPTFVQRVQAGELLVAGKAFGTGKHVNGLIGTLKLLGIGAVIAESFASEWETNSINFGLPSVRYTEIQPNIESGELLELDLRATVAKNCTRRTSISVTPTPEGIVAILEAGGLEAYTLRRLGVAAH